LLKKIEAKESLKQNPHPENMGFSLWNVNGMSGTVQGYNGKKADYVSVYTDKNEDGSFSTFNIDGWVMPMFDVPHLKLSLSQKGGELNVFLDYIAKEDLSYSKEYLAQYYTRDAVSWWSRTMSNSLVKENPSDTNIFCRVLQSPLKVSFSVCDSKEAIAFVESVIDEFVERWLGWLDEATEIPRVRRGTIFSRDNTIRRINWQVLAEKNRDVFAEDSLAKKIAAAQSGPGNEQYVGQAS